MAIDFSYIDHDILGDVADAIRFVEGSTAGIAPADYPQRIRALDNYIPDYDVLNFTLPNGGTISLNKIGNPTVVELEYWLDDNGRWIIWQPDANGNRSMTLTAGQRMYIRNTSETATGFSTSTTNFYVFLFDSDTYGGGSVMSLICKNPTFALVGNYAMRGLFSQNAYLITSPEFPATTLTQYCYEATFYGSAALISAPQLPATVLQPYCYRYMFGEVSFTQAPDLNATTTVEGCYYRMFRNSRNLNKIAVRFTNIATNALSDWTSTSDPSQPMSPTGDFYCPAELTIPTGASGIPSGWTRHDI